MMNVDNIKKIAIVGAGLMGHGIAQEFAFAGYEVQLNDVSKEKLEQALKNISANLQMLLNIGSVTQEQADSVLNNIHIGRELKNVAAGADVVIETVSEKLELKREIFQKLDQFCPEHTILASNTSTIMPSMLASATQRPEKVLVAHYFNPPYLLPLVEIVRHKKTSDETVKTIFNLLTKIGKNPAVVQKEVPGFIGNRLQLAVLREALSIVEQGIATPQDVDIVVKNGFGRRYAAAGPFEIMDIAGWDLVLAATKYVLPGLESSKSVPALIEEKVEKGELGVKSGKGFYDWSPESVAELKKKIGKILFKIASFS